jgi:hypothetical protein
MRTTARISAVLLSLGMMVGCATMGDDSPAAKAIAEAKAANKKAKALDYEWRDTGKVIKKAPLADLENWMNPDLKVYSTDILIEGTYDFLKTGMSAKVEIIIKELKDVISVPIQAVINQEGKKICYVSNGTRPQAREVETGKFNDNFVEITHGLSSGEKVLLNPPRLVELDLAEE